MPAPVVPESYGASHHDRTAAWHEQRRRNARMGWVLGSIAVAFFAGFVVRMVWVGV